MRVRSVVAATVAAAVAVVGLPTTASAAIGPLPGGGVRYYLNDAFSGIANHAFVYGDPHDVVFFGDWDGQGGDTPMVRRGQRFHIRNSNSTGYADASFGYGDLFVLAWFVASAATVGGGLGTGLESDEAIRAAAYSKREEERRNRLARDRTSRSARREGGRAPRQPGGRAGT